MLKQLFNINRIIFVIAFFVCILISTNYLVSIIMYLLFVFIIKIISNCYSINSLYQCLRNEWQILRTCIVEFIIGLFIFILLFIYFNKFESISLYKAFLWCLYPRPVIDFSLLFVFSGCLTLIVLTVITSLIEISIPQMKYHVRLISIFFLRWIFIFFNCIPIYIIAGFIKFLYGIEKTPEFETYFFYGLSALVSGNVVWFFLHSYFVENLKNEVSLPHIETAHALGINKLSYLCPRIYLIVLDMLLPLFLILSGVSIFIERRFTYRTESGDEFIGMGFELYFDIIQNEDAHNYEMILGIIFTVLVITFLLQIITSHLKYQINPDFRYEK